MYAVVETGGKQYKVSEGDTVMIERIQAEVGETITLDRVLMVASESEIQVGQPFLDTARVTAEVVGHIRGPKLIVFKYRPKKRYRRKLGHRQELTRLRIGEIVAG